MRVTPKSEQECKSSELLPPGEYDAEIVSAEEKQSKSSGADMIALRLKVFGDNGAEATVFDYLLDAVPYKVRHCAEACNLLTAYEDGQLFAEDIKGKVVRVKLKIEHDKTGNYPDKNAIQDYIVEPTKPAPTQSRASERFQNTAHPRQESVRQAAQQSVQRQTRGRGLPTDASMRTLPADSGPGIPDDQIPFSPNVM
jgi:hypothetical protein